MLRKISLSTLDNVTNTLALVKRFGSLKIGALAHTILPYGAFVLNKLLFALKRAMSKLGVNEVLTPCATHASVFANRLKTQPELFVITNSYMVLAPTAEDIVLASSAALTLGKLYQIQLKFRNAARSPTQI